MTRRIRTLKDFDEVVMVNEQLNDILIVQIAMNITVAKEFHTWLGEQINKIQSYPCAQQKIKAGE